MSSIIVDEVFDGRVTLYSDLVLDYLEEAKGLCIAWPVKELSRIYNEVSQCSTKEIHENPCMEWLLKKVCLISEDSGTLETIALGFISLVGKDDVVNFHRLEEEYVGVTVTDVYKEHSTFSTLISNGQIQLLRWPINRLQWENGEPLVSMEGFPIDEALVEDQEGTGDFRVAMQQVNKKKRRYNMVNRSPARECIPSCQGRGASTKCSWEEVVLVSIVECCKRRCCQLAQ